MVKMNEELYILRWAESGLSSLNASGLCNVTLRTYRQWESGQRPTPEYAWKILRTYGAGYLPTHHRSWSSWRFIKDRLWTPENVGYSAGEIQSLFFLRQQIQALQ